MHRCLNCITVAVDEIALKKSGVYVDVLKAISDHSDNVDIQAGGLLALASLLELDSYAASSIALQGDANVIVADVKRHFSDPAVVAHGFHCLRVIVRCVGMSVRFLQSWHVGSTAHSGAWSVNTYISHFRWSTSN